MLTYTVEHNRGMKPFVQKTLYIEGKADSKQWEKLKTIFFDALNSSDHLIVNIRKVEGFDYSFTVLICSIRRTAQLLGKRLTIEGKSTDFFASVYECALLSRNNSNMLMRNTPGYLWESSTRATPGFPGEWKKRLARRKLARHH
jgi:ABC-type transporter Mla MlaB component